MDKVLSQCVKIALLVTWVSLLGACGKLKPGLEAYRAGNYEQALEYLTPIAKKAAKQKPKLTIQDGQYSSKEDALKRETKDYFRGWEAYAGSLFGLNRIEEGCKAVGLALRPIEVRFEQDYSSKKEIWDPKFGLFWQDSVWTLRSWWLMMPCLPDLGSAT